MAALSESVGILMRIRADSSQAKQELSAFKKEFQKEVKDIEGSSATSFQRITQSMGLTGTEAAGLQKSLQGLVGTVTAVAAGVGAVAGVMGVAGIALFKLSKAAADFGSEIFDASQKTGLSAESLSAMKFAAEQSGTSLDAITNAAARLAKTIGDAANGSKEAAAKIKQFGLEPQEALKDLDVTLAAVFKRILDARPGVEQLALAQAAFGRSGADLLPFLKSFDGDLAALVKRAKELGVTIDNDAARAADEFGDQLDTLNAQLAGVGRTIGVELLPIFNEFARDISQFLKDNQGQVRAWADTLSTVIRSTFLGIQKELNDLKGLYDVVLGKSAELRIRSNFDLSDILNPQGGSGLAQESRTNAERQRQLQSESLRIAIEKANIGKPRFTAPEDEFQMYKSGQLPFASPKFSGAEDEAAKKAAADRQKAREEAYQREQRAISENNKLRIAAERTALQEAQQLWEKAFLERRTTEKEYAEQTNRNLRAYLANIKALLDQGFKQDSVGKTQTEIANLNLERVAAIKASVKEVNREARDAIKNIDAQKKEQAATEKKATEKQARADEKAEQDRLDALEAQAAAYRGLLELRRESLKAERELTDIIANRTRTVLQDAVRNAPDASAQNSALLALQEFEVREAERKKQQRLDDLEAEKEASIARLSIVELEMGQREAIEELYREKALIAEEEFNERLLEIRQATAERFNEGGGLLGTIENSIAALGDNITVIDLAAEAFENLARGIGSAINQYVLYGKSVKAALQQVLAATLAQIAAEAAIQAVRAAAYGFLFLATGQYVNAGNAFASAALWAGIAVGAALLGKAIAPKQSAQSSFSQTAATNTGRDNRETSGGSAYSSLPDAPIRGGTRNAPGEVTIRFVGGSGTFADLFEAEWRRNGKVRRVVKEDQG